VTFYQTSWKDHFTFTFRVLVLTYIDMTDLYDIEIYLSSCGSHSATCLVSNRLCCNGNSQNPGAHGLPGDITFPPFDDSRVFPHHSYRNAIAAP
jgi:hypothetical protein